MAFYTEQFETFQASGSAGVWEDKVLSIFGVPANAIVEVAVLNTDTLLERSCGVRAVGSTIDNRRFSLNKTEDAAAVDSLIFHVQTDANSKIQIYAEDLNDVFFRPVGYWTSGIYIENRETFNATLTSTWEEIDLGPFAVSGDKVCEIVIANTSTTAEFTGGVREVGSSFDRQTQLHEAEGGGIDGSTLLVNAKDGKIEVWSEDNSAISFSLIGHWDPPPGKYIEKFDALPDATANDTWQNTDLSSFSVPASGVAEILLGNQSTVNKNIMGVRNTASVDNRVIGLRDAEAGGTDFGRMHVNVDPSQTIQRKMETFADAHIFRLIGYWTQEESNSVSLFIKAGESGAIDLFTSGKPSGTIDLFIGGKPSGAISLFLDATPEISDEVSLYVGGKPSGAISLYTGGKPSGETDLFIHGHVEFNAFAKVDDGTRTEEFGLFIYGGASGTEFVSDSMSFSISGGVGQSQEWNAFAKVGGIPLTSGLVTWPAFAKVDNTKSSSIGLFINAGPNVDDSISLFIKDPGTSTSLTGAVPFSGSFSVFTRVTSGVLENVSLFIEGFTFPSGATDLFMSGSPTVATDSIGLFMSGLFEEISSSTTLVIPNVLGSGNAQTSLFIHGGGC